jgi:hypothetical protein
VSVNTWPLALTKIRRSTGTNDLWCVRAGQAFPNRAGPSEPRTQRSGVSGAAPAYSAALHSYLAKVLACREDFLGSAKRCQRSKRKGARQLLASAELSALGFGAFRRWRSSFPPGPWVVGAAHPECAARTDNRSLDPALVPTCFRGPHGRSTGHCLEHPGFNFD